MSDRPAFLPSSATPRFSAAFQPKAVLLPGAGLDWLAEARQARRRSASRPLCLHGGAGRHGTGACDNLYDAIVVRHKNCVDNNYCIALGRLISKLRDGTNQGARRAFSKEIARVRSRTKWSAVSMAAVLALLAPWTRPHRLSQHPLLLRPSNCQFDIPAQPAGLMRSPCSARVSGLAASPTLRISRRRRGRRPSRASIRQATPRSALLLSGTGIYLAARQATRPGHLMKAGVATLPVTAWRVHHRHTRSGAGHRPTADAIDLHDR